MDKREKNKTRDIAREYRKKGFEVVVRPEREALPAALKGLPITPDLLVTNADLKLVVEVRTAKSIKDERLPQLAAAIEQIPDWELELIYTNPRPRGKI